MGKLPEASLVENVRFNAQVIVPNAIQGIFRRRPTAVAAATRANVDGHAIGLLAGLRRSKGPGPVWVRVVRDPALLVFEQEHIRRVLEGSPHPFASDPEAKRKGMAHFQPDALTISRGELWEKRRRFTEAVLDTAKPLHRLADRFASVARFETDVLLVDPDLDWDRFYGAFRRLTRRVLLGDSAREDEALSDTLTKLMDEANKMPGEGGDGYDELRARIGEYVEKAEEDSVVSLFREVPSDEETRPAGQVVHWMFATQETLSANAFRALALIASHPRQQATLKQELDGVALDSAQGVAGLQYLDACLEEAMRLWPTTPLLSRESLEETDWDGEIVPAGTQFVFSNLFNHRDPERHDFADRFAPEAWVEGDAADDWTFNHFSHGPQGCPGAGLALFIGKAVLARLVSEASPRPVDSKLDPERPLPHMLDFFKLRFALGS